MVTARPQPPHLFISTLVPGISLSVYLLLRENVSVFSALRAADNMLCSPTLTAAASSGAPLLALGW